MLFKCPFCLFKKLIAVTTNLRRRTVTCQRCGEKIFCILNRRRVERTNQSGRVLLLSGNGKVEVSLFDISDKGAGFEMDIRSGIKISVGREIELKCGWNSRLLSQGRYVVRSVRGLKVGVERR